MKKFFLFVFVGLLSLNLIGQNKPASPKMETENSLMKITYGAPSKKDRVIFGGLVPYDAVWRTGANEATEVTFKKDVKVGGKSVKAGTYTLFTIPTASDWTIILNSELKQWGAFGYDKVKDKNVAEVKVPSMKANDEAELFTISTTDGGFDMMWDKTKVSVPVK
ncbi:MAG: DUF2911 domain-containing protein [Saprospiraceae bacterium]